MGGRSAIAVLVGGVHGQDPGLLGGGEDPAGRLAAVAPDQHGAARGRPRRATRIGPRTVVWLNDAQHYLLTPTAGLGEQVAAGLRELLRGTGRLRVLVLATVWPRILGNPGHRP